MHRSPQPPSLKARAVHWLSQREHSEAELRRKLMRAEREAVRRAALADVRVSDRTSPSGDDPARPSRTARVGTVADAGDGDGGAAEAPSLAARVDAVIHWLREHDVLSDRRFVESRVHVRSPGHGMRRIRQELEQHGLALPADVATQLRASEFERADAMRRRRFGDGPADENQQARCARWLVQRGFSGDTVARVVRAMRQSATTAHHDLRVDAAER